MRGALLGPSFGHDEVHTWMDEASIGHEVFDTNEELCAQVAEALDGGAVVGWFQGAMEFGPRALGNRSILADPRDPTMVARINGAVKRREGFRPFAPAVLADHAAAWFDIAGDRAFMTFTAPVTAARRVEPSPVGAGSTADGRRVASSPDGDFSSRLGEVRSLVPAVTHVDGTARLQPVDRLRNPLFHELLTAFHARTGCPMLVNTSFNRADEPIVRSPAEAWRCFEQTDIDILVIERCLIRRTPLEP
jgi:carbamoyltransferase